LSFLVETISIVQCPGENLYIVISLFAIEKFERKALHLPMTEMQAVTRTHVNTNNDQYVCGALNDAMNVLNSSPLCVLQA
jgi:hypothetical protein